MIRPNPIWRSVAILGVAGLVLTACGGDDDDDRRRAQGGIQEQRPRRRKGRRELKIGTLLPQTGSLAFLGPPEFAGVDLALKDINDAGGVNGKEVKKFDSDSGDTSDRHRVAVRGPAALQQGRRRHRRRIVQRLAVGHRQDRRRRHRCRSRRPTPRTSSPTTTTRVSTSAPHRRTSSRAACSATRSWPTATRRSASWRCRTPTAPAWPRTPPNIESGGGEIVENVVYDPKACRASPPRSARSRRPTPRRSRSSRSRRPRRSSLSW